MPNYCDYAIKVVGKKKNCDEFVKRLKSYDEPNHFWRIFEAVVYDTEGDDNNASLYIDGYCAWSLESCCRASGYSRGVDLFAVNTEELNLKMEACGRELGIGFEEHYIYDNGECLKDQCVDATGSAYADEEEVIVGGFGDEYMHWNI